MSYIAFTSPSDERLLRGTERAYAGNTVMQSAAQATIDIFGKIGMLPYLNREHYATDRVLNCVSPNQADLVDEFRLGLSSASMFGDGFLVKDGKPVDSFQYALNTAIETGSDAAKLLTRLHGQCELHAWVDGPDRAWLADIIDTGVRTGELRSNTVADTQIGHYVEWTEIAEFLRSEGTDPVVTSYSVSDGFPNPYVAGWEPENVPDEDDEAFLDFDPWVEWEKLSLDERWKIGMDALRAKEPTHFLQLRPDNWNEYRFGHCISARSLSTPESI